ncbi:hypothetical protein [Metaclostridioides mangenotii]|uniref:hypothetical protein n=1 Tax=Metaclostridioides mangenotii TaxID=1540 RepID=UPI0026EDC587|nr:hypothetical protein [Clostridioides mangenotii]
MINNEKNISSKVDFKLIFVYICIYVAIIVVVLLLKKIPQIEGLVGDIEPFIAPGVTIFIFLYTTSETRKIQEDNKSESYKLHEKNRKNDIRPDVFLEFKKYSLKIRYGSAELAGLANAKSFEPYDLAIDPKQYKVLFNLDDIDYKDTEYIQPNNIEFINDSLRLRNYSGKDIVAKDLKLKLKVSAEKIAETLNQFGYTVTRNNENEDVDYITYNIEKGKSKPEKFILKEDIFDDKVCLYLCGGQYVTVDLYKAVYFVIKQPLICLIYGYVNFVEDCKTVQGNMFKKILQIKTELCYTDVDNNIITKKATLQFKISLLRNEEVRIDCDIIE